MWDITLGDPRFPSGFSTSLNKGIPNRVLDFAPPRSLRLLLNTDTELLVKRAALEADKIKRAALEADKIKY
jgi:hypothetical protein